MASYGVIYLAFHGGWVQRADQGWKHGLLVGADALSVGEIGTALGRCEGAVVHLASCEVLKQSGEEANDFYAQTGARALCGYERAVEWVDSAAFDQLLLGYLANYDRVGDAFRYLQERHSAFADWLEWEYIDPRPAALRRQPPRPRRHRGCRRPHPRHLTACTRPALRPLAPSRW